MSRTFAWRYEKFGGKLPGMDHPGHLIAEARTRVGLSQRQLTRLASVASTTLRQLEAGETKSHEHTIGKIWRAIERALDEPTRAEAAFRSGAAPEGTEDELPADTQRQVQRTAEETEGELPQTLVRQLRERDIQAVASPRPTIPLDLIVLGTSLDNPNLGEIIAAFGVKAVGSSSDRVCAGMRQLTAASRRVVEGTTQPSDPMLYLVIERAPTGEELDATHVIGVILLSPDDWSGLVPLPLLADHHQLGVSAWPVEIDNVGEVAVGQPHPTSDAADGE